MVIGSIAAGLMITLGASLYLKIGGVIGALFFSLGLLSIMYFKFYLFTGKAGLLIQNKIDIIDLFGIWVGNFCGCIAGAFIIYSSGLSPSI